MAIARTLFPTGDDRQPRGTGVRHTWLAALRPGGDDRRRSRPLLRGDPSSAPRERRSPGRSAAWLASLCVALALLATGCATSPSPSPSQVVAPSSTTSTLAATTSTTSAPPTTTTTVPAPKLELGDSGPAVLALQERLISLGYWLGTPDGTFGDSTQQAVYAIQKAAGIGRDGIVGPLSEVALTQGVLPHPRSTSGYVVEVDLEDDLVMFVTNGRLDYVLNTSTGGGYSYTDDGVTALADTPVGHFQIYRQEDGMVIDSLGELWRPKFFDGGFAIHGDSSVPPHPVSHGCVRVSDEAIDWIWAVNLLPIGTTVWVY